MARRSPNRERLIAALCPGHLPGWLLSVVPGLKLKAATGVRREHGGQKPRANRRYLKAAQPPAARPGASCASSSRKGGQMRLPLFCCKVAGSDAATLIRNFVLPSALAGYGLVLIANVQRRAGRND